MPPLELIKNMATRLRHLHCHIALNCPIGITSELASLSARVKKFQKGRVGETLDIHGSDKNAQRL